MVFPLVGIASLVLFATVVAALPYNSQDVLDLTHTSSPGGSARKLQGKFLHITDIHPDPFYRQGSGPSGEHPCHRGDGAAGYFGAEKSECDSPFSLVNATFDWIKDNIKDEIDFVVWTGDSARHDNDEKYPRSNTQVEQLNEFVVTKFREVFGRPNPGDHFEIPIVPTYGNNDILPHNIFGPGPNRWTKKYLTIWDQFVPQEQRHSFARGGYFYTEVIPNKLAVFSLNTLYFFDSNAAVDGCDAPNDPGYEHFEWLRVQLEFLRHRKMKAILMGHVPPARTASKQNWDESCYQKYTLWLRQYRDVIVANLFGHMNIDHFILQDIKQLTYKFEIDGIDDDLIEATTGEAEVEFVIEAKSDYLTDLRQTWGDLPSPPVGTTFDTVDFDQEINKKGKKKKRMDKFLKQIGGPFGERFSLSLVSPSVVPNYFPTLRIIKYNITGLEHDHLAQGASTPLYRDSYGRGDLSDYPCSAAANDTWDVQPDLNCNHSDEEKFRMKKPSRKKKHGKKPKPNFPVPDPPAKSSPPGPAYSPQTFSFISWSQLYANLTKINQGVSKELDIDPHYETSETNGQLYEEMFRKHFKFELEYHTKDEKVYHMKDLTMRSWLAFAEKLGRETYNLSRSDDEGQSQEVLQNELDVEGDEVFDTAKKRNHKKGKKRKDKTLEENHLWHAFVKRAFVGSKDDSELQDEFG